MLPLDIILVRHGQSEGNVAVERSRAGDNSDFTAEFMNRHSAHLRLTEKGKLQAEASGRWLKENGLYSFDRYYVSEYLRAMETAALLSLPDAKWYADFQLRESDHGLADIIPSDVRKERFGECLDNRKKQVFYTPWPEGESIVGVCDRLRGNIVSTLHRECSGKRVIIVSHGDVMRAFRVIFERISADEFHKLDNEEPKHFKIGNGQIIHYTRVNPRNSEEVLPHLGWVRSVNPWEPSYAGHDWRAIERHSYSNEDLFTLVNRVPRLVNE